MAESMTYIFGTIIAIMLGIIIYLFKQLGSDLSEDSIVLAIKDATKESEKDMRSEIREINKDSTENIMKRIKELGESQMKHLEMASESIDKLKEGNEKKLDDLRVIVD